MKRPLFRFRHPRRPAFTLVELLVVIAIIAILAAATLSVGSLMIREAKKAKAANTATQIQTAALGYYTEYSVYPVPSGTTTDYKITDATGSAASWQSLIYCLSGNVHPSTALSTPTPATVITNSRGIAFLSLKSTDVDANDGPLNPLPYISGTTTNNYYFNIAIDSDYDGVLGVGNSAVTTMPNFGSTFSATGGGSSTAGVAVWANCNGSSASTTQLSQWYVHTY